MANHLYRSVLTNPVVLWADLGLRALDMTLSSSHHICDGVDRLTRAAASDRAIIKGTTWSPAVSGSSAPAGAPTGLTAAANLERSSFDPMMKGWLQWMSTLGTVASFGAGHGFGKIVTTKSRNGPGRNASGRD